MKLAVNYSPEAAELYRAGDVAFDLFKCPDWDDLIAEAAKDMPLYVHFPLITGKIGDADLRRVETLLEQTDTPYINLHLNATTADFPDMATNTRDPADTSRVTEWLVHEVSLLTGHFGAERVIAENLIYRGYSFDIVRPAVLPQVIGTVLEATGCGFLLDISHARIAAYHLGIEAPLKLWDYLDALPTGQLKELHVTGLLFHDEKLRDHFGFTEGDWSVLEAAFAKIRSGDWAAPGMVSFEYGGIGEPFAWRSERSVLARDVPRLYDLVRASTPVAQAPT